MTQKTLCHDALATRNSQFNRKKLNTAQPRTLQLFIFFFIKNSHAEHSKSDCYTHNNRDGLEGSIFKAMAMAKTKNLRRQSQSQWVLRQRQLIKQESRLSMNFLYCTSKLA